MITAGIVGASGYMGSENMNLMFGLGHTTGLQRRGLHPY